MLKNIIILLVILIIIYLILIMPKLKVNSKMSKLKGWHYAHRGLHDINSAIPENSLKAFQKAVDNGYGIELDVQITKDKIPIIMHDYSLKRSCGVDLKVYDLNYEELEDYRLFNTKEKIPSLREALNCIDGKVPVFVELKIPWQPKDTCEAVSKELESYKGFYAMESFNPLALIWYKKNKPEVLRGQLSSDFNKHGLEGSKIQHFILKNLLTNVFTKPDFIAYHHIYKKGLSFNLSRKLYKTVTVAWTIRSKEEMEDNKKYFDLFIFEGFLPGDKYN